MIKTQPNLFKKILSHKVFQTFGIYTGASMINRALPFLLLPVMTRYLTPTEYGILAIYQALISFATPFIGMSMQNNITREFYRVSQKDCAKLMSNLIVILVFSTSVVLLCVLVYSLFFASLSDIPAKWLYTIPLITFMTMINQFNLVILRNKQKAFTYGAFEISNTVLQLILSVIFVVLFKAGWEGRAHPTWICALVFGIIGMAHMIRSGYLEYNLDWGRIKANLKIALPLISYALGGIIIFLSDRFFIDHMAGKAAVGIYAVGYSFGMIVTLFKDAFAKAWSPWLYRNLAQITEDGKLKIVRFTYLYMIGIALLALLVTFGSHILIQFMANTRYHGAKIFIIWIALANAVNGMYSVLMPYYVHMGKTKVLAGIMFGAAVMNLLGNYVLIKLNGPVGAAQATLLAFCFSFSVTWLGANRIFKMPWFSMKVFSDLLKKNGKNIVNVSKVEA